MAQRPGHQNAMHEDFVPARVGNPLFCHQEFLETMEEHRSNTVGRARPPGRGEANGDVQSLLLPAIVCAVKGMTIVRLRARGDYRPTTVREPPK
jgi:hypothetical protein